MGSLGGGFVGTEFQQRFGKPCPYEQQSTVQRLREHPVKWDLVLGSVHSDRQDHEVDRQGGLVGDRRDADFLRYLYCIGFVDGPSPVDEVF